MEQIWWWLAWSALLTGCLLPGAICFWLLARLRVAERQLERARAQRWWWHRRTMEYRISFASLVKRQAEWLPKPKDMDDAFIEAEKMANLRIARQAGRVTRARSDAGPPAKVSRLHVSRAPKRPL